MRSEHLRNTLVAIFLVATACAKSGGGDGKAGVIGIRPESYSAPYMFRSGADSRLSVVNNHANLIETFDVEPFAHVRSLPLPFAGRDPAIVADPAGEYVIAVAGPDYAIVHADGSIDANPTEVVADLKGVAYDPGTHTVVLSDATQSLTMLLLSPAGGIADVYRSGALVNGKRLIAGTMLQRGRLAVSLGTDDLLLIDVPGSVAAKRLVKTELKVPAATSMQWLSSVPEQPDVVMIHDGERLVSFDVAHGEILDQTPVPNADYVTRGHDYAPHVVMKNHATDNPDTVAVLFIGAAGKFSRNVIQAPAAGIAYTWLDPATDTITATYGSSTANTDATWSVPARSVLRMRMADNLALDRSTIPPNADGILTPNHLVVTWQSRLGRAERRSYGRKTDAIRVEGYNLDALRD